MATFTLPLTYDADTFNTWSALFGESFTSISGNRVDAIAKKYPGKAKNVSLEFSGDLEGITAEDVKDRIAHVTARPIVMAKQTKTGKFIGLFKSICRYFKRKVYTPIDYNINVTIVCSVVVVEPEEAENGKRK